MEIRPLTTQAAVYCIREQLHAGAARGTPEMDKVLIELIEAGEVRAGLREDDELCLERVGEGVPFAGKRIFADELRRRLEETA
jgi:hypothetical protein